MNVPEYRNGVRRALNRFHEAVDVARKELTGELESLDNQFFEEQPREAEVVIPSRRRHAEEDR